MARNPQIIWHASKFQIVTGLFRGYQIVDFRNDGSDSGLYMRFFVNGFRTPLAARGTREALEQMVREVLPDV